MNVRQEAIPYHVDVRNIARERRSLPNRERPTRKCLLEQNNARIMPKNIGLELSKFGVVGDATHIPGDDL